MNLQFGNFLISIILTSPAQSLRPEILQVDVPSQKECEEFGGRLYENKVCTCDSSLNSKRGNRSGWKEYDPEKHELPKGQGCRCLTAAEARQQARDHAWKDINVAALQFCTGFFDKIDRTLKQMPADHLHWHMEERAKKALTNMGDAELVCRTVLSGTVTPEHGDEELKGMLLREMQNKQMTIDTPEPKDEKGARYIELFGKRLHWEAALSKVCSDECQSLMHTMKSEAKSITGQFSVMSKPFGEMCAERVVKNVEAEILGCCARACGWNKKTCTYWPFMTQKQKDDWNLQCCAEATVLQGSSREAMCNSVVSREKAAKLTKLDPPQNEMNEKGDAKETGQDSENVSSSLLEIADNACSELEECPEDDVFQNQGLCVEASNGAWRLVKTSNHRMHIGTCHPDKSESTVAECEAKGGPGRVVAWHDPTCYVFNDCEEARVAKRIKPSEADDTEYVLYSA